jgi:hypothetical protein
MGTITAGKLRKLLDLAPDNTPIYVLDEHGDGLICDVALHSEEENQFNKFTIRIDYIL